MFWIITAGSSIQARAIYTSLISDFNKILSDNCKNSNQWSSKIKKTNGIGVILLLAIIIQSCAMKTAHYTIGTGSKGATFYPLARALCTQINQKSYDFTCEAVSTAGSFYNLNAIENGEHDLALSQLHLQYQSYNGTEPFKRKHHSEWIIFDRHFAVKKNC